MRVPHRVFSIPSAQPILFLNPVVLTIFIGLSYPNPEYTLKKCLADTPDSFIRGLINGMFQIGT